MIPFPEPATTPVASTRQYHFRLRFRLRRRRKASDPRSWNLTLASTGTGVPARMALECPALLTAAVEDLEWRLALEELRARRPHRWQKSALDAWTAEREQLEQERRRIAEIAAHAVSAL
ncbi:hypothetical protein [Catenulispora subtropica]|uniref:Uncharacterized protein n=1 Tax=Catenulispora subtropica TaxID=450798 RepID=A0ABN2TIP0_9ACTN